MRLSRCNHREWKQPIESVIFGYCKLERTTAASGHPYFPLNGLSLFPCIRLTTLEQCSVVILKQRTMLACEARYRPLLL